MGFVRILLASCVVMEHAPISHLRMMSGGVAVELFFIISGFYMALVCATRYPVGTPAGRAAFYLARFLRLWPVFAVISVLTLALYYAAWLWLGRPPTSAGLEPLLADHPVVRSLLAFSNTLMIGQDIPSLFHVSPGHAVNLTLGEPEPLNDGSVWMGVGRVIPQAWSIGTEIWFYLLVPFLTALSSRSLAIIAGLCLALRFYLGAHLGLEIYFFFFAQLPLFIFGMLAYRHGALDIRLAIIALVAVCAAALFLPYSPTASAKWAVYLVFALGMKGLFELSKSSAIDRYIGELSYPVYMSHVLLLAVLTIASRRLGVSLANEIVLPVSIIASLGLLHFVDMPVDRLRAQLFARRAKQRA